MLYNLPNIQYTIKPLKFKPANEYILLNQFSYHDLLRKVDRKQASLSPHIEINPYIFYKLFIFMSLMKCFNIASNADDERR